MTDTTLAQRLEIALAEWDSYDPFASNDKAMAQAMAVIDASRALIPEIARLTAANKALTAERDEARQSWTEAVKLYEQEAARVDPLLAKLAKVEAERDAALKLANFAYDKGVQSISAELAEARKREELARKLEPTVEFVARMAWRTDPPNSNAKLTDGERLSAIKFHPVVKHFGQPHIELAEREALSSSKEPGQ